jgi:hypothetical protein
MAANRKTVKNDYELQALNVSSKPELCTTTLDQESLH